MGENLDSNISYFQLEYLVCLWGYNVSEHTCDLFELFFNAFDRIPTMIYKQAQGHSSLGV